MDETNALELTSRWPHTMVNMLGYAALFAYLLSLGLMPR